MVYRGELGAQQQGTGQAVAVKQVPPAWTEDHIWPDGSLPTDRLLGELAILEVGREIRSKMLPCGLQQSAV